MRRLNWFAPGRAVEPQLIEAVERDLGVRFPDDYRAFVQANSGAESPDESVFWFDDGGRWGGCFGALCDVDPTMSGSIAETVANLGIDCQLPAGAIPIIETGMGDYVCLSYENGLFSSVQYFHHGRTVDRCLTFLAPTFTAFLDMLEHPED